MIGLFILPFALVDKKQQEEILLEAGKRLFTPDVYYKQALWNKLQDNVIHTIDRTSAYIEKDLNRRIEATLYHNVRSTRTLDVNNFDDFYNAVVDQEKKTRLQSEIKTCPHKLFVFNKLGKLISEIWVQKLADDVFSMREKIKILVSKYDADYYVTVGEVWGSKNDIIEEQIPKNYQRGNIIKLPKYERVEALVFCGKTKNTISRISDKSEIYEIIRENPNNEESRIVELRKDRNDYPMDMEVQFLKFT